MRAAALFSLLSTVAVSAYKHVVSGSHYISPAGEVSVTSLSVTSTDALQTICDSTVNSSTGNPPLLLPTCILTIMSLRFLYRRCGN